MFNFIFRNPVSSSVFFKWKRGKNVSRTEVNEIPSFSINPGNYSGKVYFDCLKLAKLIGD